MVNREDIEAFLDRLTAEGATQREIEPGMWIVRPGGAIDFDVVVTHNPPVMLLRVKVWLFSISPPAVLVRYPSPVIPNMGMIKQVFLKPQVGL